FKGTGIVDQAGTWRIDTSFVSNRGPIRTSETLELPAADATVTLRHAIDAMEQLRSAQMREELRGTIAGPPNIANYSFEAPDAFTYAIDGGAQNITIGRQQY